MIKEEFDPNANAVTEENGTVAEDVIDPSEETAVQTEQETEKTEAQTEQEAEETPETPEAPAKVLCPRCGERNVSKGHEYCYRCEEALSRTRVPIVGIIAAVLALAASVFCLAIVSLDASPAIQAIKGDRAMAQKNVYAAYDAYNKVDTAANEISEIIGANSPLNKFVKSGLGLKLRMFKAIAGNYNPLLSYQRRETIFGDTLNEKYLEKDKDYLQAKGYYELFQNTYLILQEPIDMMEQSEDSSREYGQTIIDLLEEKRGQDGVDDVTLDFFIYNVYAFHDFSKEEVLDSLKKLDESANKTGLDYSWLYYKDYARALLSEGRPDEAMKYIDALAEKDISAYDPALYKMQAYLLKDDIDSARKVVEEYRDNNKTDENVDSDSSYSLLINMARVEGDYDKATELITEAQEKYNAVPEYNRQVALIYLAQGKYDEAYEAAYACEQMAYYLASYYGETDYYSSDMLMSTVYLSAKLCDKYGKKNTENAEHLEEVIDSFETITWSKDITDIIEGKADVKDYLTKGVCDFI